MQSKPVLNELNSPFKLYEENNKKQRSLSVLENPKIQNNKQKTNNFIRFGKHNTKERGEKLLKTAKSDEINEHLLDIEEVAKKFNTRIDVDRINHSLGLTESEAIEILAKNGPNCLTPPPKKSMFLLFLSHYANLFNVLLLVSGVLSFILYAIDRTEMINLLLGGVLFFVATMNSLIEFYQEFKSTEILNSFKSLVPSMCTVIRDGKISEILTERLVVGDIISVKSGDKIPADLRIIKATDFKVDNSSITGESEPQERFASKNSSSVLESGNLAFSGTMAVSGDALGIVVRCGDSSLLGQIAKLTCSETNERPSQMSCEIDVFVKKIAFVAFITALIFFIFGLVMKYSVGVTFSFAIGLFVAFVPQGIPATVTLLLTIAAKRLSKKNVLVKDLHGIETLGAITLLATDKTGTLTQNKMSVVGVWMNKEIYSTTGLIEGKSDQILSDQTANLNALVDCCALCTKSKFDPNDSDKPVEERNIFGDATEAGLLRFASNFIDVTQYLEESYKVFEIPFNSSTKWHMTINSLNHQCGPLTSFIKGAPERIVKLCKWIQVGEEVIPWTEETTDEFNRAYEDFASRGQRVLAFGREQLSADLFPNDYKFDRESKNFSTDNFVFIGLISLMDPPKKGVKKAVAACRTAGIQVVMVTGDHPLTAEAIARKIGLIQGDTVTEAAIRFKIPVQLISDNQYDAVIIHGDRLDSFTDEDWDRVLSKREIVFARTSPKHKLEIVTRFQSKGHIVGVSGDGVNDSPALKKADLGISMNRTASDVSKEAASMILLDDNFASIVTGISEGRLIFANLKKSIRYTLTHLTPEISAFILFIVLGVPPPLSSILTLLIDLGTELGPAISYAFECPEGDLMLVPPRKVLTTSEKKLKRDTEGMMMRNNRLRLNNFLLQDQPDEERGGLSEVEVETPSQILDQIHPIPIPIPNNNEPSFNNTAAKERELEVVFIPLNQIVWYQRWWIKLRSFLRDAKGYTGETLIDNDMLLWCYFQGGIIEAIGCFGCYFLVLIMEHVPLKGLYHSSLVYFKDTSPDLLLSNGTLVNANGQLKILARAQAAFFLAIVIGQSFNLFIQKHRYSYPWGRDMLLNKWTWIGLSTGVMISILIVYVPFINFVIFAALPIPWVAFVAPIILGIFLFIYEFVRRFLRKRGYFGGVPKRNINLVELVRTTSSSCVKQ